MPTFREGVGNKSQVRRPAGEDHPLSRVPCFLHQLFIGVTNSPRERMDIVIYIREVLVQKNFQGQTLAGKNNFPNFLHLLVTWYPVDVSMRPFSAEKHTTTLGKGEKSFPNSCVTLVKKEKPAKKFPNV